MPLDSQDANLKVSRRRYLAALGSNLPRSAASSVAVLERALALFADSGLTIRRRSRWFRTAAWPIGSGPDFVNGAVAFEADAAPVEVLSRLHRIEAQLGRVRVKRWEPRTCDIDLLACGEITLPDRATLVLWMYQAESEQRIKAPEGLILPHPRLHERAFVLVPLAEIAPEWLHPQLGQTVDQMLAALPEAARLAIVAID